MDTFWAEFLGLLEDEYARGIVSVGLMVLLSIPKRALGEVLKAIPDRILPPENIPPVLALVGLILGILVGTYSPLPMDLSITVGTGAGAMSGTTHDIVKKHHNKKKGDLFDAQSP